MPCRVGSAVLSQAAGASSKTRRAGQLGTSAEQGSTLAARHCVVSIPSRHPQETVELVRFVSEIYRRTYEAEDWKVDRGAGVRDRCGGSAQGSVRRGGGPSDCG